MHSTTLQLLNLNQYHRPQWIRIKVPNNNRSAFLLGRNNVVSCLTDAIPLKGKTAMLIGSHLGSNVPCSSEISRKKNRSQSLPCIVSEIGPADKKITSGLLLTMLEETHLEGKLRGPCDRGRLMSIALLIN
ncbi:hypothetical protein AVEN_264039-1 [Araneus ventricosus]|uniref:Uncharacterized protein n=1 Tax=Araneus ventricosus TaxID=182803 RepID=A0A4Y2V178_ARAVE|nr:hypothetical protein AVEN_258289-1 [Araneus ventricosus]GBO17970.1 hypothetical protein AVEN_264039-1 [Araneus ventricosus]